MECMDRSSARRRKQMDRVAVALGFKELPNRLHLHELRGFVLYLFHHSSQFERLALALRQILLEVAFVTEMASEEHEGVDVAPDLGKLRHIAHFRSR